MPTTPVVIRDDFNDNNSPCISPTNENYAYMLDYHKLGDDYEDTHVAAIMQAYIDYDPETRTRIYVEESYSSMLERADIDCAKYYLRVMLSVEGVLTIEPEPTDAEKVPTSCYPVSLFTGLLKVLEDQGEPISNLYFQFTNGRAEFEIGSNASKWYTDDCVLIAIMVKDDIGKRYLGVYDMSIPPDDIA